MRSQAPGNMRVPRPPDPNWNPDFVMLDEDPPVTRVPRPSNPRDARRSYLSWLQEVSIQAARRKSLWRSDSVRVFGMLIILAIMVGGLWGCWIAWNYDPEQAAREAAAESSQPFPAAQRSTEQGPSE